MRPHPFAKDAMGASIHAEELKHLKKLQIKNRIYKSSKRGIYMFLIETKEPISITCHPIPGSLLIKVDGIPFAVLREKESYDIDKIRDFVENTYYDEDYKSVMYTPGVYDI